MEFADREKKPAKPPPESYGFSPPQVNPSEASKFRGYGANYGKGIPGFDPDAKQGSEPQPQPLTTEQPRAWWEPMSEQEKFRGYDADYGKGFPFLEAANIRSPLEPPVRLAQAAPPTTAGPAAPSRP